MHYPQRNRKRRSGIFFFGLFFIVGIIVLANVFSFQFLAPVFSVVGTPLWKVRNGIAGVFESVTSIFASKAELLKKIERLEGDIKSKEVLLSRALIVNKENTALKELVGRTSKKEVGILGNILSYPGFMPYDIFLVDVGSRDGVVVGSKVLSLYGNPIGVVESVLNRTSRIKLYSSAGLRSPVRIGDDSVLVDAHGQGAGNFVARIPKGLGVAVGDTVTLIGENTPLGRVDVIGSTDAESFEYAYFTLPISLWGERFVRIVNTSNE